MDNYLDKKLQLLYRKMNSILPSEIDYGEFKLVVDETSKLIYRSEDFYAISKQKFFDKINKFLSPGLVLDIGANNGFNTILFSKRFPKSTDIIAVEPNPKLINFIRTNIILNNVNNVTIIESMVGSERSDKKSRSFQINNTLSVDSRVSGLDENFENITVDEITIDEIMYLYNKQDNNVFIKIDTQGWEKNVIDGFKSFNNFNFVIQIEFAPYWLRNCGTNPEDFFSELCNNFIVTELPKFDLYRDNSIESLRSSHLHPDDAKTFVKYVEESGKNMKGWCDLLLFKKLNINGRKE